MKSEILSLLRESMLREKAADAPAGENQPAGMPAGKEQPAGMPVGGKRRQAGNIYRARSFAAVLGCPERLSGK